ncbi:MAG: propionyl-CoA synthetase [Alphaproteobacteria bacterium]
MSGEMEKTYRRSIDDPAGFWAEAAAGIDWIKPWDRVLDDDSLPHVRWFAGAELNTCYNAVDRHVEAGRGDQAALIYDSAMTGAKRRVSYTELQDQVSRIAGVLKAKGVGKGDRVIIYMPMIPEAVVATLACARLGTIHSIVFGGFAANELAVRIDDCGAKAVISASCGLEPNRVVEYKPLLDAAIDIAKNKPETCIIFQRPECQASLVAGRDVDWVSEMESARAADCVPVAATDPLYILYTSGTTGAPKGVVRDNGGHAVAIKWSMKNVYNVEPGAVYWAASDVGWVVGHSYIIYGPLLHGCTSVMFEGKPVGTPDPGSFWRIIEDYKVEVLFTAPTAIRAIKQQDPAADFVKNYDTSSLKSLFLAGERSDPDTIEWAQRTLGVRVIDHWWQTETGWAMAANCIGIEELPVRLGSPTRPVPGWNIHILSPEGQEMPRGEVGAICVKQPMPPSSFLTLWNADARFKQSYFDEYPGYYKTGDAGMIDDDGYVFVMARTDDVINVAGHRLSTGAIEEVLASHPEVAECAVMGVSDALKGQAPVGLLVLNAGCTVAPDDVAKECVKLVRDKIGPVAAFKSAVVVKRLPKTRSGKILRGTMSKIADGASYPMPATIEDPAILDEIEASLASIGYAKK